MPRKYIPRPPLTEEERLAIAEAKKERKRLEYRRMRELASAFGSPAPCDACDNYDHCADNRLACQRFGYFVDHGVIDVSKSGDPGRGHYAREFPNDPRVIRERMEMKRA